MCAVLRHSTDSSVSPEGAETDGAEMGKARDRDLELSQVVDDLHRRTWFAIRSALA